MQNSFVFSHQKTDVEQLITSTGQFTAGINQYPPEGNLSVATTRLLRLQKAAILVWYGIILVNFLLLWNARWTALLHLLGF
jgi:hypothetical protein